MGGTRRGGADVNIKHSGRDDASRYDDRPLGRSVLKGKRPLFYYILVVICYIITSSLPYSERDRGDRRDRSRDRDREKDRDRRRSRSRERRRRSRSRERERDRDRQIGDDNSGTSRRRERERDRSGAAVGGGDSRSRERSRERKRRSRSKDRKRDRDRGKAIDGEEVSTGDVVPEGGERMLEEHEIEVGEGMEERRDRDRERDRDRRRSHRDRDRRRSDRDREHKRERGERERGDRRDERHTSLRDDMGPQDDMSNEDEGGAPAHMQEYSQDGMTVDQQSVPLVDGYGSSENGYKLEASGDDY